MINIKIILEEDGSVVAKKEALTFETAREDLQKLEWWYRKQERSRKFGEENK